MHTIEYWDLCKPTIGETYRSLIKTLCANSDTFYFITRKELSYDQDVLKKFNPYIVNRYTTKEWANTMTMGPPATIYQMEAIEQTCLLLQQCAHGLYDWVAPTLPEDLTFIKNDFPWFSSTTHEELAGFVIRSKYYRNIILNVPGLHVLRTE
ncbi:hypothetical protein [Rossellomorea sp. NPDC077527]|uniref:hypothetical protein n=1 Tax=Rossellomorea sp. NPDC077527 TaxID=3364510 RepID=UPI0037CA32DA